MPLLGVAAGCLGARLRAQGARWHGHAHDCTLCCTTSSSSSSSTSRSSSSLNKTSAASRSSSSSARSHARPPCSSCTRLRGPLALTSWCPTLLQAWRKVSSLVLWGCGAVGMGWHTTAAVLAVHPGTCAGAGVRGGLWEVTGGPMRAPCTIPAAVRPACPAPPHPTSSAHSSRTCVPIPCWLRRPRPRTSCAQPAAAGALQPAAAAPAPPAAAHAPGGAAAAAPAVRAASPGPPGTLPAAAAAVAAAATRAGHGRRDAGPRCAQQRSNGSIAAP